MKHCFFPKAGCWLSLLAAVGGWTLPLRLGASGLTRDGTTARTQALAGASVAVAASPLEAMTSNPAALPASGDAGAEVTVEGIFLRGDFQPRQGSDAHLRNRFNFLGDLAIAFRLGQSALHAGFSASPSYAAEADWRYLDAPGGLDGKTSYGEQDQQSKFLAYNFQAGLGVDLASWCSVGISAGAIYNYNSLQAPYVFQSQETLQGIKTKLDLEADGVGPTAQLGLLLKPTAQLRVAVTYTTPTQIDATGDAHANLSAQFASLGEPFASIDPRLDAKATVKVRLPQKVSVGVAWQPWEKWLFTSQVDWINWSAAFDDLEIDLRNSSNGAVNGLVGDDDFADVIPLGWRDQTILRFGCEYQLSPRWKLRAGYSHTSQVVPSESLTPLSGALAENLVSAGIGYARPAWHLDFAWQWNLPEQEQIGTSALKTGEYSGSKIEIESHWFGLTYGMNF